MNKRKWLIALLSLAALNVALFWPWQLYFLNDDFVHIPLTDEGKLFQNNSIRPLHELLVRMDLMLYGKEAYGYHITSLLLHFIVCFQLFWLSKTIQVKWLKVDKEKAMNISFLATALFLIYPQHAESLAWVLGRTPTMSAIFLLFTIQLFFAEKFSAFIHFIGFLLFCAAMFTYEQGILLPIMFGWLSYIEKDKVLRKQKWIYSISISIAAIVYVTARKIITADIVGTYEGSSFLNFDIKHLAANFLRLITRLWLNPSSIKFYMAAAGLSIAAMAIIGFINLKKILINKKTFLFFKGMIVLLIVPIISLGITIRSHESGRYLYLPSIFLAIGLAMLIWQLKKNAMIIVLVLIGCYWGFGKFQAASQYKVASNYVLQTHQRIFNRTNNFENASISLDTLRLTVHRIPVFRVGFNQGLKWQNPTVDTSRVTVKYYYDEFTDPKLP
jgi:hypothetical protein